MSNLSFLKEVCALLQEEQIHYAIAGGLAANVYRREIRGTSDLDLSVASDDLIVKCVKVLKKIDFTIGYVGKSDLEGGPLFSKKKNRQDPQMLIGREKVNSGQFGIDFLLETLPWVRSAIDRAQSNQLNLLFGVQPVLTKEDVLISKLYSYKNNQTRYKDLDDIQNILANKFVYDEAYLLQKMNEFDLYFLKVFHKELPAVIGRKSRKIERALRNRRKLNLL